MNKELLARLSKQMETKGVNIDETTKKEYFTGYEYKTLYDWDQYFETIIQLHLDWNLQYAKNGVTIFLDHQQENGFISRTVPIRDLELEGSEHVKPFLSQIVLLIYNKEDNIDFITDKYYEKLKKYLNYWLFNLDKDGNYLSTWNSAPHTGMDNQHERSGYWFDCFCQGVDLSSFLYRECLAFAKVAELKNKSEDYDFYIAHSEKIKEAVQDKLWCENDGFFYDLDERTNKLIKVKSSGAFSVLWAGLATEKQAERMVKEYLLNQDEFWRPFPIPSYAKSEPGYSEEFLEGDLGCSWRANTWIPVNYYVAHGLVKYGYSEVALEISEKTVEMLEENGEREYYTSESRQGCGLNPFWGWTLLGYFMPYEIKNKINFTKIDI